MLASRRRLMAIKIRCVSGPHEGRELAVSREQPLRLPVNRPDGTRAELRFEWAENGWRFINTSAIASVVDGNASKQADLVDGSRIAVGRSVFVVMFGALDDGTATGELDGGGMVELDGRDNSKDDTVPSGLQVLSSSTDTNPLPTEEEKGGRTSRRISASRQSAVELPERKQGNLLRVVSRVFKRPDEPENELETLLRERTQLLAAVGREALEHAGGIGLPEDFLQRLGLGETVSLRSGDLSAPALERWRRDREHLAFLDATIAKLRGELNIQSDTKQFKRTNLESEVREKEVRAFKAMDDLGTEMLDGMHGDHTTQSAEPIDDDDESRGGRRTGQSGRRRARRRRR